jgi:hypothetical protein
MTIRHSGFCRTSPTLPDFVVARIDLDREKAYLLLSSIDALCGGAPPCPIMATRLIVREEPLGALSGAANCLSFFFQGVAAYRAN